MTTMARLTQAYHPDDESYVNIGRRHLPFVAGENIMMLVDLNSKGLVIDSPKIRGRDLEMFTRKYNLLTPDELRQSLEIDETGLISVLNQCVQCVGCRRRVERLFYQLTLSGHPTLYPLVFSKKCKLTVVEDKLKTPQTLGTLLYRHHENLNTILENKLRTKTRCVLHSLDAFRSKPFSETWREVWSSMNHNCRDELAVIETCELHEVLENYLKKHKFCTGCRAKIEKAYKILIGSVTSKEKGFIASLYSHIKKCQSEQHIHIATNKVDFLDALIKRAEPEVTGSYSKLRERHAKTLEVAQEEVLICVGMIMYERLRRIYVSSREEERACQVLAAISVHALCRSFDTYVEMKQGISNLELLYQEMSRAEKAKALKREQKKLKKKIKKNEKKISSLKSICSSPTTIEEGDADNESENGDDQTENQIDHDNLDDDNEKDEAIDVGDDIHKNCGLNNTNIKKTIENSRSTSLDVEKTCKSLPNQCEAHLGTGNTNTKMTKTERKKRQKQKNQQKKSKNNVSDSHGINKQSCENVLSERNIQKVLTDSIAENRKCLEDENLNEKCSECLVPTNNCPCDNDVKDSGYGSEINLSPMHSPLSSALNSPDGSEVSCSDGFCNHEPNDLDDDLLISSDYLNETSSPTFMCHEKCYNVTLSLQQLLDQYEFENSENENCDIPEEVLLEYQYDFERIKKMRQNLRETLRQNFKHLCLQRCKLAHSNRCNQNF